MAWYDEAGKYYQDLHPDSTLTQGDIILAPTSVIFPGTAESDVTGPTDLAQLRRTTLWVASADELPAAPPLYAETRWGAAMVIPHPCAMEKEWNERVQELIADGATEDQAIDTATADTDLDRYVTLAPLLPYEDMPANRHRGIQTNQRLGNFPVCESDTLPSAFVDFARLSTVHYSVALRKRRVASLSTLAVAHLHHALVMHFAYRGYAGLSKIEQAVGRTITDLKVSNRAKNKIVVNFILDNGETLTMESQDNGDRPQPELERATRP